MVDLEHFVGGSGKGRVLFRTWLEALALWVRIVAVPGLIAAALMPDHIHCLLRRAAMPALRNAMNAYARWRNAHRGESGPVWVYGSQPDRISGPEHVARLDRYTHMNPCRAKLVDDPLAWPFSTHRDAVGLAIPPVRRRVRDPVSYHRHVSADPSTHVEGTPLPEAPADGDYAAAHLSDVFAAVSSLTRTPAELMRTERNARDLLIRAAKTLTSASTPQIADLANVSRRTVQRADVARDPHVQLVARVLGDPRFAALEPGDLRRLPAWSRFRKWR